MKRIIMAAAAAVVSICTAQAADNGGFGLEGLNMESISRMEAPAIAVPVPVSAGNQRSDTEFYLVCSGKNGQEQLRGLVSADSIQGITLTSEHATIKDGKLERVMRDNEESLVDAKYTGMHSDSMMTLFLSTGMDSDRFKAALEQKNRNEVYKSQLECRMDIPTGGIAGVSEKSKLPASNLTAGLSKVSDRKLKMGDVARVNFAIGANPAGFVGPNGLVGGGVNLGPVVSLQLFPNSPVGLQFNLQPGGYWGSGETTNGVTTNLLYNNPESAILGNQWEWVTDDYDLEDYHVDRGWLQPAPNRPVVLDHYIKEEVGGTRTRSRLAYYTIGNVLATVSAKVANDVKLTFFGGMGLAYRNFSNYTEGYHKITQVDDHIYTYTNHDELVGENTYTDSKGDTFQDHFYHDVVRSEVHTNTQTLLDEGTGVTDRKHYSGWIPTVMAGVTAKLSEKLALNCAVSRLLAPDVESRIWNFSVGISLKL